ncbi:TraR/DksA family transcriptional regulator [Desulfovibrio ferrophilus]|uniref:RNA polymerase-binding transcription factor DksA n=1 Tax=Desulfovibrio ferrophilus TaxID=241368 RepID=A0A2Z6AY67_9BACT|nr:RNA polymerase-binding transcription factor DksA [Desulfovibrio ferrophilus]
MITIDQVRHFKFPKGAEVRPLKPEELVHINKELKRVLSEIYSKGKLTAQYAPSGSEQFADPADRASSEEVNSVVFRLRDREHKMIRKIKGALSRMENGEYGICEECGEYIAPARLLARPVTSYCLTCKTEQEVEEKLRQDS